MDQRTPTPVVIDSDIPTLGALLREQRALGDTDALVFPDVRFSYAQLEHSARQWAKALIAAGVQAGEHVGLLFNSHPDFVQAMFGIAMAGAVSVPINARYQAKELAYLTENADLVALILDGTPNPVVNFAERLGNALASLGDQPAGAARLSCPEAPKLRNLITTGVAGHGFTSVGDFLAAGDAVSDAAVDARIDAVSNDQLGLILYTSGTTSNPKGCLLTHRGMVGNARSLARRYDIGAGDRFWSPLPIFHIAGILPLTSAIDAGGAYLTIPNFDAGVALAMLEDERATHTYPCFVTIMQDLINHPNFPTTDLSRVRLMNSNLRCSPHGSPSRWPRRCRTHARSAPMVSLRAPV